MVSRINSSLRIVRRGLFLMDILGISVGGYNHCSARGSFDVSNKLLDMGSLI